MHISNFVRRILYKMLLYLQQGITMFTLIVQLAESGTPFIVTNTKHFKAILYCKGQKL